MLCTSWLHYLISQAWCARCASFTLPLPGAPYEKEKHALLLFSFWDLLFLNLMSVDPDLLKILFYPFYSISFIPSWTKGLVLLSRGIGMDI